ncbi:hypothetical protein C7444_114110 [Sphaerotilus hippei]|uniref:DUF3024 family protein n=1 Tax=Sphaerotilus hippei TaxID=744406 RepID=A0A318H8P4_9BURK|nr:hypothetical protein [Sphaerotilus hippei]PXW94411.1 hypothetical protein C7444_114110 [Sphaerotilus hippei]
MTPHTVPPRGSRPRPPGGAVAGPVTDLSRRRIERALERRARYKYVQPRLEREGHGWKIVSANCSRNIDPMGGEIDIAWFEPEGDRWALHARDHASGRWVRKGAGLTLPRALDLVCEDRDREYWQ